MTNAKEQKYFCIYLPGCPVGSSAGCEALQEFAANFLHFTPLIAVDSQLLEAYHQKQLSSINRIYSGLILDISGTQRLHKGDRNLARKIQAYLLTNGLEAKIGSARTIGAAWALSRFGDYYFNPIGQSPVKTALADFPAAALRLDQQIISKLQQVGLYQLKDIFSLPARSLLLRFGYPLLRRIDQLLGHIEETAEFIHSPERFFSELHFDYPLKQREAVAQSVLDLFKATCRKLLDKKKKAASFLISLQGLYPSGGPFSSSKEISLTAASGSFTHLSNLLAAYFESMRLPAEIYFLRVEAKNTADSKSWQENFIDGAELINFKRETDQLLDRLSLRIGRQNICRIKLQQSYVPEHSFSYQALDFDSWKTQQEESIRFADRPSLLLDCPESIKAISLLPDHPPSWIEWKGGRRRIIKGFGPECISEQWWTQRPQQRPRVRQYFKVQDEAGRWLWIFRDQQTHDWFLHGVWN